MRSTATFELNSQPQELKQNMLNWVSRFSMFLFLDSNNYRDKHSQYDWLLAAEPIYTIGGNNGDLLAELQQWHDQHKDWLFGHISYDYKNNIEPRLSSRHEQRHNWPGLQFFCPAIVITLTGGTTLTISCTEGYDPHQIYADILATQPLPDEKLPTLQFTLRQNKEDYLQTIEALRTHIRNGDCYEINYGVDGYATVPNSCQAELVEAHTAQLPSQRQIDVTLSSVEAPLLNNRLPLTAYRSLSSLSPAPFAALYRLADQYLVSASPERYLQKRGNALIAQPIKGTARRGADEASDTAAREALHDSAKDRAENVMIVDLMRNDLARSCTPGTVQVDELFGIYTFPQVHQMISTISGTLREGATFADALRHSFPMGSMTGAPKIKVMELIEQYEAGRRGLFSGTVGYVTPTGDFDFNVIIRSLFYSAATAYLSYTTGGAITYDSHPEGEWEEMRLKAWALERLFG